MSFLSASHLHWSAGGRQIVKDVSVDVAERECVGVIGPAGGSRGPANAGRTENAPTADATIRERIIMAISSQLPNLA